MPQQQSLPPPRPSSSASINSFHFEQLHLLLLLFILLFYLFSIVCVSVKFATVWNCGKSSSCLESFVALVLNDWPCCLLLLLRSQRAYVNNHFGRPSVRPRLSALSVSAAARNFVGKLRLMIMFNELYNKYIAAAAATEAAATAHGTWTPKIAGTLRKVPEFMSLPLSLSAPLVPPPL